LGLISAFGQEVNTTVTVAPTSTSTSTSASAEAGLLKAETAVDEEASDINCYLYSDYISTTSQTSEIVLQITQLV